MLTLAGFGAIALLWAVFRVWPWSETGRELVALLMRLDFVLIGAAILHLTVMLTLAIGCVVVLIMKGPRYSADSYPVQDADRPGR